MCDEDEDFARPKCWKRSAEEETNAKWFLYSRKRIKTDIIDKTQKSGLG